jgi:aromatic ring-opening dioxygenase LigB subunit
LSELRVRVRAAIVPHAPVLLPQLASSETLGAAANVGSAVGEIDLGDPDVVVLVTPHGVDSGVYREVAGSLDALGPQGVHVRHAGAAEEAEALARGWGRPRLDGPLDHGGVVPLVVGAAEGVAVVAAALRDVVASDGAGLDGVLDESRMLADAVRALARDRKLALVCSAHSSAALSPRAPLTERAEARAVDDRLLDALRSDAGALGALARRLWADGGACGVGPLAVFGHVCAGRSAEVLCYERPLGIGYLVACA